MVIIKDIPITAKEIEKLEDKHFTILAGSFMKKMPQAKGDDVEKLVLPIKLVDGTERTYIPNQTSKRALVERFTVDTDKWVDQTAEFELTSQIVNGDMKKVIYVI